MTSSSKLVVAVLLLAAANTASFAQQNPGAAFAVSDGQGHVHLLWFPPASQWPVGGWRISDASGNVLVPKVVMGDTAALAALPIEDADTIRRLPDELGKPSFTQSQHQNFIGLLGIRAFSDVNSTMDLNLKVLLKKLAPKFISPFQVIKPIGSQVYRLLLPSNYRIHNVFYVSRLEKYTRRPSSTQDIFKTPILINN